MFISNTKSVFQEFDVCLDTSERKLIQQKITVLDFINTDHTSKDTAEYLKALRESEAKLIRTMDLFLQLKRFPEFREEASKLCDRCKDHELYVRDMEKRLSSDLTDRYRAEDKKKMDMVKDVGFLFTIPVGFVAAVKNGFGNGIVNPYEAGSAGFTVSIGILSRKKLIGSFKNAGKAIVHAPQQVRKSFVVYYARETIKEKRAISARAVKACGQRMGLKL